MATVKQLRELFVPILAQHPNLVLRRRWLFRPPVETAIVGLYIGRTAYASCVDMALSVLPLSRFNRPSRPGFDRTFEVERVVGVPPPRRWVPGEEEPPRILQDLFAPDYQTHLLRNFNAKVPPFLDAMRTFDDLVAWIRPFREPPLRMSSIELIDGWIAAMRGDFAEAADQLQAFFDLMGPPLPWAPADERQQQEALRDVLRTGDRTTIAAFLHAMEEQTVTHYDLRRFWRRTPFPFERG